MKTLGPHLDWVWLLCFVSMLFFSALGILLLTILIYIQGNPSRQIFWFFIPLAILLYCVGALVYYRVTLSAESAVSDSEDEEEEDH